VQIPDTEAPTRDLLALINTAHTITTTRQTEDGKSETVSTIDNEGIFWETQNVSSSFFGAFVKTYKNNEALIDDCYNHMTETMAKVFAGQIARHLKPYRYGVEAKSSETVQDKNNNKQNLIDKIKENKQIKEIKMDDERKRNALAGIFGLDKDDR
jgi:hypothetical protein